MSYSNADTLLKYLESHPLYSIKAKSLEKLLEIYQYSKTKKLRITKVDYSLIKRKAAYINNYRKLKGALLNK